MNWRIVFLQRIKKSFNWSLIFISSRDERVVKLEHDISLKDKSLYLKEREIAFLGSVIAQNTGAREDFAKNDENTPLLSSGTDSDNEIPKRLRRSGANKKTTLKKKGTILHFAAQSGLLELVMELVEEGADMEALDEYGRTPLNLAAMSGPCWIRVPTSKVQTQVNAQH